MVLLLIATSHKQEAKWVLYWGLARTIHNFLLNTLVVMVAALDLQASVMERECIKSMNDKSTNLSTLS